MNAISVLYPYKHEGLWVFDDPAVGLRREPFVSGIDTMIDLLVAEIPGADRGFRLLFSPTPFPGHTVRLEWRRSEYGGNWYWSQQLGIEGWLCPALFKYFGEAPRELYARAEAKAAEQETGSRTTPMSPARSFLERFHRRLNALGAVLLMLPILAWVWLAANEPVLSVLNGAVPRYVLSGKPFTEPFNTVHAGFALDQPTIGKWLFWFSVMTASSLPWAVAVGWLSDRRKPGGRLAFAVLATMLSGLLLCMLSWPMIWLVQYVSSMGLTPRRLLGLLYAVGGGMLVVGFWWRAVRK